MVFRRDDTSSDLGQRRVVNGVACLEWRHGGANPCKWVTRWFCHGRSYKRTRDVLPCFHVFPRIVFRYGHVAYRSAGTTLFLWRHAPDTGTETFRPVNYFEANAIAVSLTDRLWLDLTSSFVKVCVSDNSSKERNSREDKIMGGR